MKNKVSFSIAAILLLFPVFVGAYYDPGKPTGFVNDYAGVIDATIGKLVKRLMTTVCWSWLQ